MPVTLVDSHCHLNYPDFSEDLDQVIENARNKGIGIMQTICTKITEFAEIKALSEKYSNIYCSVGIHPHEVETQPKLTSEEIIEHTKHNKVIGIGETGLDYFYEHSPRDLQQESFREHITACRETQLPLIVHTRDADDDTMDILEEETKKGAFPGLIHCFSSSRELAERALKIGFYISISGIVTFKKATELKEIVADVPLEKMLVETDAPFLAPVPYRGKRNEPAYTYDTAAYIAELKGTSIEEVAEITTKNFHQLFTKAL